MDKSPKSRIFSHSGPALALFAKQPLPGQVKTRLTPPLTAEQSCRLYEVALRETVERLQGAGLPLVVCYAGERRWFAENFPDVPLLEQRGEGLAARMSQAVQDLFTAGAGPVLLCGSDSPDLPISLAVQALEMLHSFDVVTVPCDDGGYAMIGLREPVLPVFSNVPWSTGGVQVAFREQCLALGLTYRETGGWHDLDKIDDLRRMVKRSPTSRTSRHLATRLSELL